MSKRYISLKGYNWYWLTITLSVILLWSFSVSSFAVAGPKSSLSMATDRIGTTFNAMGSGFAKVVSQFSKTTVVVRPFSGPDAWLPALNKGEMELGAISAFSAWQAYNAIGSYKTPLKNFRLLRSGAGALKVGFSTLKKSGIKRISELKGKRVASGFGGHIAIMRSVKATLKTEGLEWSDVVQIPVTGANDGIIALGDGRVDAAWASYAMPSVRQLNARAGVRFLPLKDDPKSLGILRKYAFPGVQLVTVKKGSAPGILEDTPMITYDSYLIATADLDDETVTAVLNTLWDHTSDLFPVHRAMKGFNKKSAVTTSPVIPYHPAAIRFYKQKGVWKEAALMSGAK
jgi:hypothetical protein